MSYIRTRTRAGRDGRRSPSARGRTITLPLLSLVIGFSLLLAACGPTQDVPPTAVPAATTPTSAAATATTATTGAATATTGTTGAATATIGTTGAATATTGNTAGATATTGTTGGTPAKKITVGILQTATHPALDFTREGVKQAFTQGGYVEGQTVVFDVQNMEGDAVTGARMADGFISKKVDAIIGIGTPATQAILAEQTKQGTTIPTFFCAVADPYGPGFAGKKDGATITQDPKVHPPFLTGVQAFPPVQEGLNLIKQVLPSAKTVGLLWNPNEPNSKATTDKAREVSGNMGLTLIDRTATKPADTLGAAQALAAISSPYKVDAFFVSTTNSVVAGLDSVVRVAQENHIPLFGNDPLSAARGAVAAQGLDYTQNGLETGQMAVSVLTNKATIQSLPVQSTTKEAICVNTKAAELQAVTLPQSLLDQAKGCTYTDIKSPIPPTPAGGAGSGTPAAGATATKAP